MKFKFKMAYLSKTALNLVMIALPKLDVLVDPYLASNL